MTEAIADPRPPTTRIDRCIGSHQGAEGGPLLVCVGAIHGNEHAGVAAARRVLDALAQSRPPFRGRFVALVGNVGALQERQRFRDLDLNRAWLDARLEELRTLNGSDGTAESEEQRDLLRHLARELDSHDGPAHFVDLHSSSADGAPFVTVGDTLRNRAFALQLGLPLVLGLEEQIDGALLEYINNHGHITAGVEGGRHDAPSSVDHHESVLWLALVAAGLLDEEHVAGIDRHRRRLRKATPGVPKILQVMLRHEVHPEDRFVMKPGYRNFDPVHIGEMIAEDIRGPIHAPESCRLLLPLYQAQGSDGYFTVKSVQPFWLRVSGFLRWLGVPRHVAWLPGVRRHPTLKESLVVNTRIAHFLPLQLFHLLGYRKRRWEGDVLLVSRRRHDVRPGGPVHVHRLDTL